MQWQKIDNYHIRDGEWTITKAFNVPYQYGLHHGQINHGYFKTREAAEIAYMELIAQKQERSATNSFMNQEPT